MFYSQLIALCAKEGVKPTPLIRSLGFSAGNIKRWKNGATVNSDILIAVAEHFKVSTDYLLFGDEKQYNKAITISNGRELQAMQLFNALPEPEQLKLIGRMELLIEQYKNDDFEEAEG